MPLFAGNGQTSNHSFLLPVFFTGVLCKLVSQANTCARVRSGILEHCLKRHVELGFLATSGNMALAA